MLATAPFWLPIQCLRHRGHFFDGIERAIDALFREAPFRHAAQRAGIQRVNPFVRFPGIDREQVFLVPGHWTSSHEQIEYPLLAALCSLLKPQNIFEFGTYFGEATLMFAKASPDARIQTLNIPEDVAPSQGISAIQAGELISNSQIGKLFKGTPEENRITQILCDSAKFDDSERQQQYDFIWVDAGHSYENVMTDSRHALKMVSPGGHVFWHDFDSSQPGVVRALTEIAREHKLFWIEKTSIVGFEKL
mgnify:FL=1